MTVGPTVRRRSLAHRLRAARQRAGMTLDFAARESGVSQSHLSRVERAQVGLSIPALRSLAAVYVMDDSEREVLEETAKGANAKGWWHSYGHVISEQYSTYIGLESDAKELRVFAPLLIDGLIQTEEYAREIVRGGWRELTAEEADRQVEARIARQGLLKKDAPPRIWMILDESVLRRRVGGAEVQRRQLDHIRAAVERFPQVTMQILPQEVGANPGQVGPFTILDFPDPIDPGIVYLETYGGNLYLDDLDDIERARISFEHLSSQALPAEDSIRMLGTVAAQLLPSNGKDAPMNPQFKPHWRKASRSAQNGACVEVCSHQSQVLMQDSQLRTGETLAVSPKEWSKLLADLRDDEAGGTLST